MGKRTMTVPNLGFHGIGGVDSGGMMTTTMPAAFVTSKDSLFLRHGGNAASTSTTSGLSPPTFLSLSSSAALADESMFQGNNQSQRQNQRVVRPDEPNLFEIPPDLSPTYRPIPIVLRFVIVIASALFVGRSSVSQLFNSSSSLFTQFLRQSFIVDTPLSQRLLSFTVVRKALFFLLRTALVATIAKLSIQEKFLRPSQVTTEYLRQRGKLPSRLSQYYVVKPVAVSAPTTYTPDGKDTKQVPLSTSSWKEDEALSSTIPIGVHSIQYTQQKKPDNGSNSKHNKYDGIYLYHGFGASSLSWLPVLPCLVDRLGSGSSRGLAHDAPGFGFTDRPNADVDGGLEQYEYENNVGIGLALLNESLSNHDAPTVDADGANERDETKSIAIFGHSMGSKSALLTALHYASHPKLKVKPNLVVLVAPALEGLSLPSRKGYGLKKKTSNGKETSGRISNVARKFWIEWKSVFLEIPFRYALRRVVCGTKDFWRKGLSPVWGKYPLSESDVLRFKWPSISKGWEDGVINFAQARIVSSKPQYALDDGALLQEVVNLKGTKVVIVYGSADKVVRIDGGVAEMLERDFPTVKLVRMEGLGHDPFEEDVDGFLLDLEEALE